MPRGEWVVALATPPFDRHFHTDIVANHHQSPRALEVRRQSESRDEERGYERQDPRFDPLEGG